MTRRIGYKVTLTDESAKQLGTTTQAINLVLNGVPQTLDQISLRARCKRNRVVSHLGTLKRKGVVAEVDIESGETEVQPAGIQFNETEYKATIAELEAKLKTAQEHKGPRKLVLVRPDMTEIKLDGLVHEKFEQVLQLGAARMNIFLYGPTGCGKTHICQQVADGLGLKFYSVSCTSGMSEGVLGGRLLPVGKAGTFEYVKSDFVKAYEEGGVFLLDEIDAADSNVLLLINSALANGVISVPNRPATPYARRHPDFVCVAAANTIGTGADRMYAGRNQLDAATLDRFIIGKVKMEYDVQVEEQLCPDRVLLDRLWAYRRAIVENRLERAMSTRFIKDAFTMKKAGWSYEQIANAFFTGWRPEEVSKVRR